MCSNLSICSLSRSSSSCIIISPSFGLPFLDILQKRRLITNSWFQKGKYFNAMPTSNKEFKQCPLFIPPDYSIVQRQHDLAYFVTASCNQLKPWNTEECGDILHLKHELFSDVVKLAPISFDVALKVKFSCTTDDWDRDVIKQENQALSQKTNYCRLDLQPL